MSILCLVMHVLCVYVLKLLSDFFWDKIWLFLVKAGWQSWLMRTGICKVRLLIWLLNFSSQILKFWLFLNTFGFSLKSKKEVTMDTPVLRQFKSKGQFVIQTAWILWPKGYVLQLQCQWFSVKLFPCRNFILFFSLLFSGLGVTFRG